MRERVQATILVNRLSSLVGIDVPESGGDVAGFGVGEVLPIPQAIPRYTTALGGANLLFEIQTTN